MFSGWGTSQGQKSNLKAFSHKVLYNYYSNFFYGFRPIFNQVKKWISHCIFESCAEGFGFFFSSEEANFFCQMACIYLLNSRGGPQSFDFDITHFISNYSYPLVVVLIVAAPAFLSARSSACSEIQHSSLKPNTSGGAACSALTPNSPA